MNLALMVSAGASAGLGAIVGGLLAWQVCARRAEQRHRRLVASARDQYAAGTQGLRATNARLQAALDQEKQAVQARVAAAAAEHRADMVRVEGQLRFAYAEIDRLQQRGRPDGEDDAEVGAGCGFALTRPFER